SFLDWNIFKKTDADTLTDFYSTKSDYLEDFKGYYALAIDGSQTDLPNAKITREEFDVQLRALKETESPKARISTLCDVKNDFILDSAISPISIGEHALAQGNIKNSRKIINLKKSIIIFDRLYPSTELYLKLIEKESKFIFRLKKTDYIHERKHMRTNDEYVDIKLNATRTHLIKNNELKEKAKEIKSLNLRIVNVKLETGET
ncbi:MAG: transposase, partial [Methanobrevibacter sp.]|nr:transposase [Methanobrevibacter sp.]